MAEHDEFDLHRGTSRRTLLRGAALAGLAGPVLVACGGSSSGGGSDAPASGEPLAKKADVPEGSGVIIGDTNAGTILTQPTAGKFNGFVNQCKHQNCPLANVTQTINCTCHGSQYDLDGNPVTGPNGQPASTITALDKRDLNIKGDEIFVA